jgi:hypothetical protein
MAFMDSFADELEKAGAVKTKTVRQKKLSGKARAGIIAGSGAGLGALGALGGYHLGSRISADVARNVFQRTGALPPVHIMNRMASRGRWGGLAAGALAAAALGSGVSAAATVPR